MSGFFTIRKTGFILSLSQFLLFQFFIIFKNTHTDNLRTIFGKKFCKNPFLYAFVNSTFYSLIQRHVGSIVPYSAR